MKLKKQTSLRTPSFNQFSRFVSKSSKKDALIPTVAGEFLKPLCGHPSLASYVSSIGITQLNCVLLTRVILENTYMCQVCGSGKMVVQ